MLQEVKDLTSPGVLKGLNTQYNLLSVQKDQSPNMMNVKVNYDGSIEKRLGSNTQNILSLSGGSSITEGFSPDSGGTLLNSLSVYYPLDEVSGTRFDIVDNSPLLERGAIGYASGIKNQCANFVMENTSLLATAGSFMGAGTGFTTSFWFYTTNTNSTSVLADKNRMGWNFSLIDTAGGGQVGQFTVRTNSSGFVNTNALISIVANSFGVLTTTAWYNAVCWWTSGATGHIGISINGNTDTSSMLDLVNVSTSGQLFVGGMSCLTASSSPVVYNGFTGRIDEIGYWKRPLTDQEKSDLYNVGSGNTYQSPYSNYPWACFDFGASADRWLTCAMGTGVFASSNLGLAWTTIATDRTATYQYFDRSKNVMIMTSEAYDRPLYWAGSAGTYAAIIGTSTPLAKYSINFQGFLILLNSKEGSGVGGYGGKRMFHYIDENYQLSSTAWLNFPIPSSADDEITNVFVLRRYLYVSTRYKIFRISYVGGNPDWQFVEVKGWGYVPRTVKRVVITNNQQQGQSTSAYSIGEVVIGLTYDRKIRIFDGSGDQILSNNVEKDNGICEFALDKISYLGSGPLICFAEVDPIPNVYSLCVGIGLDSMQTTHFLNYDGRSQALFAYDNMHFNCMCIAESANRQFLMAFDRKGLCHMMNSGNLDGSITPINDYFESPLMFEKSPSQTSKGHKTDIFFSNTTSGNIYYQDRIDYSDHYHHRQKFVLNGSSKKIVHFESIEVPEFYNVYQFRLTSSMGTSEPWRLQRYDHFTKGMGIGRND